MNVSKTPVLNFSVQYALPATPAEWWTVLTEGEWQHPAYGKMKFTRQRLQRFVDNFHANAYGTDIPLDVNHMWSAEGAPGWLTDMRVAEVEGKAHLQVRAELNDLGDKLITNDRVRYISASFCDEWTSPEGNKVRDLMVGVALTERPYFKHLGKIVATEFGASGPSHTQVALSESDPNEPMLFFEVTEMSGQTNPNQQPTPQQQQTTPPANGEEQVSLADLQARIATLETQNQTLTEQNRQATEGLLSTRHELQLTALTTQLTATNFGSEGNPYRLAEAHCRELAEIAMMLSEAAPVDAEGKPVMLADNKPLPAPRERLLAFAKSLASGLVPGGVKGFAAQEQQQVGGGDQATAIAELNTKIDAKIAAAKDAGRTLDYVAALSEVAKENPQLVEAARG